MRCPDRQRGAALIIALLVVALVVFMAAAMASDFLLLFRRVDTQWRSEQAWSYLLGSESVAKAVLLTDLRDEAGRSIDSSAEEWARPLQLSTGLGSVRGQLRDLQARFNINALRAEHVDENNEADAAAQALPIPRDNERSHGFSSAQERFIRLLLALPLREPLTLQQATALMEAVTDWIDEDDETTGAGGAESGWYGAAKPPGRAANRPLAAPSELRWVRGMTPEIWLALAPLISVWPISDVGFNVNVSITRVALGDFQASLPARLLLATLGARGELAPLPAETVEVLLEEQIAAGGFHSLEAFTAGVLRDERIDTSGLAVRSDWFELNAETELDGQRFQLRSVLYRDEQRQTVRVVARTRGEW